MFLENDHMELHCEASREESSIGNVCLAGAFAVAAAIAYLCGIGGALLGLVAQVRSFGRQAKDLRQHRAELTRPADDQVSH